MSELGRVKQETRDHQATGEAGIPAPDDKGVKWALETSKHPRKADRFRVPVLLAVGGNYATKLVTHFDWRKGHHTEEGKVLMLQTLAKELGYKVVKDEAG